MDEEAASTTARTRWIPLLSLLSANAISMVGNQVTMVAVPWSVLETTGSESKTGLTTALIPGYALDWLGQRWTLLGSTSCDVAVTLTMLSNPAFRKMDQRYPTNTHRHHDFTHPSAGV